MHNEDMVKAASDLEMLQQSFSLTFYLLLMLEMFLVGEVLNGDRTAHLGMMLMGVTLITIATLAKSRQIGRFVLSMFN
jgi:carboxypeptidase C (cathepsin A)